MGGESLLGALCSKEKGRQSGRECNSEPELRVLVRLEVTDDHPYWEDFVVSSKANGIWMTRSHRGISAGA